MEVWEGSTLEERSRASSRGFWEGKCGIKRLGSTRGKGSTEEGSREERVEGSGRKYAGGGTTNKLKRILREVRDKTFGKYGELKEVQKEKEVRGCGTGHKKKIRWRENRKGSKSS